MQQQQQQQQQPTAVVGIFPGAAAAAAAHVYEEEDVDDLMSLWGKVSRMSDFDLHVDNNIFEKCFRIYAWEF